MLSFLRGLSTFRGPRAAKSTHSGGMGRRMAAIGVGCLLLAPGLGFDAQEPTQRRVPAECQVEPPAHVVLIAVDGVRWQEIYEGTETAREAGQPHRTAAELTPHLHALMQRGVALGAPGHGTFSASGPNFAAPIA